MENLNTRQKKFVDEYIKSGNASLAARSAGYAQKDSDSQAARLMKNPKIKTTITARLNEIYEQNTATLKETLSLATQIMRGKCKETTALVIPGCKDVKVLDLPPRIETRLKAAQFLHKVLSAAETEGDKQLEIRIVKAGEGNEETFKSD